MRRGNGCHDGKCESDEAGAGHSELLNGPVHAVLTLVNWLVGMACISPFSTIDSLLANSSIAMNATKPIRNGHGRQLSFLKMDKNRSMSCIFGLEDRLIKQASKAFCCIWISVLAIAPGSKI